MLNPSLCDVLTKRKTESELCVIQGALMYDIREQRVKMQTVVLASYLLANFLCTKDLAATSIVCKMTS